MLLACPPASYHAIWFLINQINLLSTTKSMQLISLMIFMLILMKFGFTFHVSTKLLVNYSMSKKYCPFLSSIYNKTIEKTSWTYSGIAFSHLLLRKSFPFLTYTHFIVIFTKLISEISYFCPTSILSYLKNKNSVLFFKLSLFCNHYIFFRLRSLSDCLQH